MAEETHDTEVSSNNNDNEQQPEKINWSLSNKEDCVKYIRASLSEEQCQKNNYKEETLKALELRQLQAMAISTETLVEKIYCLKQGTRLPKGVGIPTPTIRNAAEMILRHNEDCIREARQLEQEAIDNEMDDIDELEELEDISDTLHSGNANNSNNSKQRPNVRRRVRFGGSINSRKSTQKQPPITGNKRGYGAAFSNSNNNNKNKQKDGPTKISPSFQKIWEKVKSAEFNDVKVYKNKEGEIRYFWWQDGRPVCSDEPPIGYALGDNLEDESFQFQLRNDNFFNYNRRRSSTMGRQSRVCNNSVFVFRLFCFRFFICVLFRL